jgi:FtsP/CotA-like multicopper oxidase with cupredoxin domain
LLQVGTDGGLFEKPVELKDIVLTTGERVEVLVRGTDPPGAKAILENLPYDRYAPQTRPTDWDVTRDLLTLQTTNDPPVTPVAIPATIVTQPRGNGKAANGKPKPAAKSALAKPAVIAPAAVKPARKAAAKKPH